MSFLGRFKFWGEGRFFILIVLGFIISRLIFHFSGVYFYHEFVKRMWQSIDIELLKADLLESLWYSHAQPPLFNLFTGIVVKVFPQHYGHVFHVLIALMTLLSCLLLFSTLRLLKVINWVALIIAFYFMLCPSVVVYESLFSYTPFVVLLITTSFFFLLKFIDNQSTVNWFLFWVSLASLALTRSSFHLIWLIVILGLMVLLFKRTILTSRYILSALIPITVVFLWYLKNLFLFGTFTASTWLGMNISRIMPPQTPFGQIGSFKPLKEYHLADTSQEYPGIKLLHEDFKQNTGYENFHHVDYIAISDQFKKEVTAAISKDPALYLQRVYGAFIIYLSPSTHGPFLDKNYRHIKPYADVVNLDFSGYSKFKKEYFPKLYTVPVVILYTLILVLLLWAVKKHRFTHGDKVVMTFIMFNLIYSMIVSNTLEYGENNRFRFELITLVCLLFGLAIRPWVQKLTFKEKGT